MYMKSHDAIKTFPGPLMRNYPHKRGAQRTKVEVPVALENGTGVTRDISRTGVYVKTTLPLELGYAVPDGPLQFACVGRVVRVEKFGEEFGFAATIEDMNTLH
jgi:hypothetical protein